MSYVVVKTIKGHPYRYRVHSERHGDKVTQVFEAYLGPGGIGGGVAKEVQSNLAHTELTTTSNKSGDIGKIIAKIRKADDPQKKTELWQSLDLPRKDLEEIARKMVLSLPAGYYKLHDRKYGTNIVDKMYDIYGWMPSMLVSESMMLGLQALYPKKVYASFTLGLDAIEIKDEARS